MNDVNPFLNKLILQISLIWFDKSNPNKANNLQIDLNLSATLVLSASLSNEFFFQSTSSHVPSLRRSEPSCTGWCRSTVSSPRATGKGPNVPWRSTRRRSRPSSKMTPVSRWQHTLCKQHIFCSSTRHCQKKKNTCWHYQVWSGSTKEFKITPELIAICS